MEQHRPDGKCSWRDLETNHEDLVDDFCKDCKGEVAFLRHIVEEEAEKRWTDPQIAFQKLKELKRSVSNAKVLTMRIRRAAMWPYPRTDSVELQKFWYGRAIPKALRWGWFCALVPYMKWKRGTLNWIWLSRWVDAIEGGVPGDCAGESLRTWWFQSVRIMTFGVRSVSALSKRISQNRRDDVARRKIGRHFSIMRLFDAAWSYVRFDRNRRRPRPTGDISDFLGDSYVAKTPGEVEYVKKGLLKTFGFLRTMPMHQQDMRDYCDVLTKWQAVGRLQPIPPGGYIEIVPK